MSRDFENSVQQEYTATFGQSTGLFGILNDQRPSFPKWGDPRRDYQLRYLYYNQYNTLTVGALTNLIRRVKQTPWEISGGRNLTRRYQEILQNAQFGEGWDAFLSRLLQDLLSLDNGGFIEIQGPGEPDTPLTRGVTGLAVLDGLRCYATGNSEYPVYYRSQFGQLHKLHWTRVMRLVDMPSPDPEYRGLGLSAMSRSLAVARADVLMNKYTLEQLDDLPPKGFLVVSGPTKEQYEDVQAKFEFDRVNKKQEVYKNLVEMRGISPDQNLSVNLIPFSNLPEQFDRKELYDMYVQYLALAIGDDPQEIAPLSGSGLGATATQSQVLHTKGKGRIFGDLLTLLERVINISILPESLEFAFKPKDTEQSEQEAKTAQAWANTVTPLVRDGVISAERGAQLLANTVGAYADVLLDAEGQLRLPDDDVIPEQETTLTDTTEMASDDGGDNVTLTGERALKAIQSTRLDFEVALADALAQRERLSRVRFGIVLRSLISRYGNMAYEDGLQDGGVSVRDKSDEDRAKIRDLIREQSRFVTQFANNIYQGRLTVHNIEQRAGMWYRKSISPFYDAGLLSANRNGLYEWVLGPTEHCKDCLRLNEQRHRLKDWTRKGWLPQASKLECGGYNCKCNLVPAFGLRARGRF